MLYGIAKGGFGGAVAILAVPLMALIMSPTQAAGILLPILVVMDAFVVRTYWGHFDFRALQLLLPGALVGIALGYLTAGAMDDNYMRVLVGLISMLFGLQQLLGLPGAPVASIAQGPPPYSAHWLALPVSASMQAGRH
tara:strand:- start:613 stop:1026 length:414 start_codon:yes stop_codon:yes gene_type:complete